MQQDLQPRGRDRLAGSLLEMQISPAQPSQSEQSAWAWGPVAGFLETTAQNTDAPKTLGCGLAWILESPLCDSKVQPGWRSRSSQNILPTPGAGADTPGQTASRPVSELQG